MAIQITERRIQVKQCLSPSPSPSPVYEYFVEPSQSFIKLNLFTLIYILTIFLISNTLIIIDALFYLIGKDIFVNEFILLVLSNYYCGETLGYVFSNKKKQHLYSNNNAMENYWLLNNIYFYSNCFFFLFTVNLNVTSLCIFVNIVYCFVSAKFIYKNKQ